MAVGEGTGVPPRRRGGTVGVTFGVVVTVGVGFGVLVTVAVGNGVGVGVGVLVAVAVGVGVNVGVGVGLGVLVAVARTVGVAVGTGVLVGRGRGVGVVECPPEPCRAVGLARDCDAFPVVGVNTHGCVVGVTVGAYTSGVPPGVATFIGDCAVAVSDAPSISLLFPDGP